VVKCAILELVVKLQLQIKADAPGTIRVGLLVQVEAAGTEGWVGAHRVDEGCERGLREGQVHLAAKHFASGVEHAGAPDAAVGGAFEGAVVEGDDEVKSASGGGQLAREFTRLFHLVIPADAQLVVDGTLALLFGH